MNGPAPGDTRPRASSFESGRASHGRAIGHNVSGLSSWYRLVATPLDDSSNRLLPVTTY
jgi:hypothetical protein